MSWNPKSPMKLAFASFAKFVDLSPDGSFDVIGGGFRQLEAERLPVTVPSLALLVFVSLPPEECHRSHALQVSATGPDGKGVETIHPDSPSPFLLRPGVSPDQPSAAAVNLGRAEFAQAGFYTFHIAADNQEVGDVTLEIRLKVANDVSVPPTGEQEDEAELARAVAAFHLPEERLRAVADQHRPPQDWYDRDEDLF